MRAPRRLAVTTGTLVVALLGGALVAQPAEAAQHGATAAAVTAAPAAPSAVAVRVASRALDLSWKAPRSAAAITSYSVRSRAKGAGTWSAARTAAAGPYRVAPLQNGTTYELEVRAETASASGAWSAPVSAAPGSAPGAIVAVRVLRFGGSGTVVSWTRPADGGGRALLGYDVRFRASAAGAWHQTGRAASPSVTIHAALGAAAQVQVRAVSSRGAGAWSTSAAPVPVLQSVSAPTGVATRSARGAVLVRWGATAGIGDYTVRWRRPGSTTWSVKVVHGTHTTVTGLAARSHRFSVAKNTTAGVGRFSGSVAGAPGRVPATAPRSPRAGAGDSTVAVTWSRPAAGSAKAYEVRYRAVGAATWRKPVRTAERAVTVRGLHDGREYVFAVRTARPHRGPWSMTVRATPLVRAKAPTALALQLDPATSTLAASWTPAIGGPAVTGFDVRYRAASAAAWTTSTATATAHTTTLAGLPTGSSYRVQVRARTVAGGGAWSAAVSAFVPAFSLPVVDIATRGGAPIADTETYVESSVSVASKTDPTQDLVATAQVKGHGNSTWPLPKKPYKIKLDTKASLLGMPMNKHWVLLANFKDRSQLRNDVALYLGKQTGLAWTPDSRFVEVVVNGRYEGLYQLTEQVRIDDDRVAIDALGSKDSSAAKISGGYLLERDGNRDAATEVGFDTSTAGQPITVKDPEVPTAAQLAYISGYVNDFEAALYSDHPGDPSTGYATYIDVDSFVDWYIVEELVENSDAFFSSAYLYKPRGGKLVMGPLWDFDLSTMDFGVTKGKSTSWYVKDLPWWNRFTQDPAFEQRVSERWQVLKPRFDTVWARITTQRTAIATAAANDGVLWGYATHDLHVNAMASFLRTREAWLDRQWTPAP